MIYFGARYYDPDTARFITQDSYLGESNTPPSLHRYLYAYSNPTLYIDLLGYTSVGQDMIESKDNLLKDKEAVIAELYKEYLNAESEGERRYYQALSVLYGLYSLGLNVVGGSIEIGDWAIDLGQPTEGGAVSKEQIATTQKRREGVLELYNKIEYLVRERGVSKEEIIVIVDNFFAKFPKAITDICITVEKTIGGDPKASAQMTESLGEIFSPSKKAKFLKEGLDTAADLGKQVKKNVKGETIHTASGKSVHKKQAAIRRNIGEFDLVESPIKDKCGNPIFVSKRVDLKTGKPKGPLQKAVPDAVSFKKRLIIDDKPMGRSISKDKQEIIRFIRAFEQREGNLPKVIAIQRYNPETGMPVYTELYSPADFLPKIKGK